MAIKEVKAGEKYKLELLCIHNSGKVIIFETPTGDHLPFRESDLECVSPARQDVRPEHSTVSTLSYPERVWNELWAKEMRDHSKSMNPDTANGTKNTETPPKYDPNRIFLKGDRVRLVQCNGRNPFDSFNGIEYPPDETIYTVEGDEYDNGKVELYATDSCDVFEIHHSNLELVTPIEEAEPYYVKNIIRGYAVYKRGAGDLAASCVFWSKYHPNARAAAEAERDRLNAEYRKEQSND
ncbi:MAG: hypothetical protein IJZ39_12325 [Oscillospiraceae bacterium]|nr:hypothetical protein [Oscillospiraceae bacterium]